MNNFKRTLALILAIIVTFSTVIHISPIETQAVSKGVVIKLSEKASTKKVTLYGVNQKYTVRSRVGKKTVNAKKVKYAVNKSNIVSVSKKGVITSRKKGNAVVTVSYKVGKKSYKAKLKVTVKAVAAKKVSLSIKGASLAVGKSVTVKASISPSNATDSLTWKSSKTSVATVTSKGKITAKKTGTATITAKAGKKSAKIKVTVTAAPVEVTKYTVSFNTNGGSYISSQNVNSEGVVSRPTDPIKSGYSFEGWYADSYLTVAYSFNTKVTKNLTLYAKWNQVVGENTETFVINFETNGGNYISNQIIKEGDQINRPTDPLRSGFEFVGWYSDLELTSAYDFTTKIVKDITLYAKWNQIPPETRIVVFDTNGGSYTKYQLVENGNKLLKPNNPTKEGFNFEGWYTDSEFLNIYNFENDVTRSFVLYAKWSGSYSVQFVNGDLIQIQTVEEGRKVSKPENPIKDGYVFEGWYTDSDFINEFDFSSSIYQNTILYAKWTEINTVVAPDNVMSLDASSKEGLEEIKEIAEKIEEYWTDDRDTEDPDDDLFHLIVKETSPLLSLIKNGTYKENDIIYIPECEYFPVGSMLAYVSHDDKYPSEHDGYNVNEFEHIITKMASLADVIDESAYIDYHADEIDPDNPVSFVWFPWSENGEDENISMQANNNDSYKLAGGLNYTKKKVLAATSEEGKNVDDVADYGPDASVKGAGFQPQNLAKIVPTASLDKFGLVFDKIILYDKDGDKNTKNDRLTLSGEVSLNDLKPTVGVEWKHSVLPQQFIATMEYTEKQDFKLTYGGNIKDTDQIMKDLKKNAGLTHNNVRHIMGMDIEGIKMDNTVVLAAVGFNPAGAAPAIGIRSIRSQSIYVGISPTIVLMILADFEGNVKTTVVGEYSQTTYVKKGLNVQKKDFVGKYGTCEENKGTVNAEVAGRSINIYDIRAKSKSEQNLDPISTMKITAAGEASIRAGVGGGIGVMLAGVIVGQVKGTINVEAKAELQGSASVSSDKGFELDGYGDIDSSLYLQGAADVRLVAKTFAGNPGISGTWQTPKLIFLEMGLHSRTVGGTVFASDQDRDSSNNIKIDGANITLIKKEDAFQNKLTTATDADGKFLVKNLKEGDKYKITIEKNGYAIYEGELEVGQESENMIFYLDKDEKTSILSGLTLEADTDTDLTNNERLNNVLITLTKINSSTTSPQTTYSNDQGNYIFSDLSVGLYEIYFEKEGYIPVRNEIAISTGGNTSNASLEIIRKEYSGEGTIKGTIYDAITGNSVSKVITIDIYEGINLTGSSIYRSITTDDEGNYSVVLPAGNYTAIMRDKSDSPAYLDGLMNIKSIGNHTISNQNGIITPVLGTDEIRIVLEWGETPRDLDSHLAGPTPDGDRFHVYYDDDSYYYSGTRMVDLDTDDTSSYGPETITIRVRTNGLYHYAVHNYTNKNLSSSNSLAVSGAKVTVYKAGIVTPLVYYVPNSEGTVWNVFDYDSETDTIIPINTMSYQSDDSLVVY